jgi:hypothetical protein
VFSNYNGLPLSKTGIADFTQAIKSIEADCVGIAESHLDSSKNHVKATVLTELKSGIGFTHVNGVFAQSDLNYEGDRKRGGIFQFATQNLATRTTETFSDPYGRFTSQTFIGKNNKKLVVITAYRVVEGAAGPFSAYAQQRAMLVTAGRPQDPRKIFLQDIQECILKLQLQGSSIILGIDANETTQKQNSDIRKVVDQCGLVDVHATMFPNDKWASHRRGSAQIDFFFVSQDVLFCITRAGISPFDEVYDSDHRPLFSILLSQE